MKKFYAALLCLTLLLLTACGQEPSQKPANNPEDPQGVSLDMDACLELFAAEKEQWLFEYDELYGCSYALTDWNEDGWPELFASSCAGTGHFSTSCLWLPSANLDSIEQAGYSAEEAEYGDYYLQCDYVMNSNFPCYTKDGKNYIISEDFIRDGYAAHYYTKLICSFDGEILSEQYLANFSAEVDPESDNEGFIKTYYVDDVETDAETYMQSDERYFEDAQKRIMHINWVSFSEEELDSEEVIKAKLKESWEDFGFFSESEIEEPIEEDPGIYYEDPIYEEPYIEDDVIFPDYSDIYDFSSIEETFGVMKGVWRLYSGEIEGDLWYADEVGADCLLIVGDGFARLEYTQNGKKTVADCSDCMIPDWPTGYNGSAWELYCESADGLNALQMSVFPEDQNSLFLYWDQWTEVPEGNPPVVCAMNFNRVQ